MALWVSAVLFLIYVEFILLEGDLHWVVANVMVSDIFVNEFKLQLCHYIHFRTYTLEIGMNSHSFKSIAAVGMSLNKETKLIILLLS